MRWVWVAALLAACAGAAGGRDGGGAAAAGEVSPHEDELAAAGARAAMFAGGARFRLESTLQLSAGGAMGGALPAGGEAALQLRAAATVRTRWAQPPHLLLDLTVEDVSVWGRGAGARAEWAPRRAPAALARDRRAAVQLRGGTLEALFLEEGPPVARNLLRALASLLQFADAGTERRETDAAGDCDALYEPAASGLRKIKTRCSWPGGEDESTGLTSRRLVRYELADGAGALRGAYAEEVHEAGWGGARVKARGWLRLSADGPPPPAAAASRADSLAAALGELPAALVPAALPLEPDGDPLPPLPEAEAEEAIAAGARGVTAGAGAGAGGDAREAAALLRAVSAARRRPAALRRLMRAATDHHYLEQLAAVCGAAGLGEGGALLGGGGGGGGGRPDRPDSAPVPVLLRYFAALSLAPYPEESAVAAAAHAADSESAPEVRAAAALSAAAAGAALPPRKDGAPHALAAQLAQRHLAALSACAAEDDECAEAALLALANLRRAAAAAAEPALQAARRRGEGAAVTALAAVEAVAPDGSAQWGLVAAGVRRLALLPGRPVAVRAAALSLWLSRAAAAAERLGALPLGVRAVAAHLSLGPAELRRVLWARLSLLRGAPAELVAALPPHIRSWDSLAAPGVSTALWADAGAGAGAAAGAAAAAAAGAGGAVRHAKVAVRALRPQEDDEVVDDVELSVWTRGMHTLAGGADGADGAADADGVDADEAVASGLHVSARGVHFPPLQLFSSQGELLGLVWGGAGSEPAALWRGTRAHCRRAALPLPAAAQWAALRWERAAAAALDAHATVSLWARTLSAGAQLRAATLCETHGAATAWGALDATVRAAAEGALAVPVDVDFYAQPALCVRVAVAAAHYNVTAELSARAGRWAVTRRRARAVSAPGRSLALPPALSAHCARLAH